MGSPMIGRLGDPWYTQVVYSGVPSICGYSGCGLPAVRVGFASQSHRVLTCDAHEKELIEIRKMALAHGPYTDPNPPAITAVWRRDNRGPAKPAPRPVMPGA